MTYFHPFKIWLTLSRSEKIVLGLLVLAVFAFPFLFFIDFKTKSISSRNMEKPSAPDPKSDFYKTRRTMLKFTDEEAYFIASSSGEFSANQTTIEAIVCIPEDKLGAHNLISLPGTNSDIFYSYYNTLENGQAEITSALLLKDNTYLTAAAPMSLDRCHHLAITAQAVDGVCQMNIFIDGKKTLTASKIDSCSLNALPYSQLVIGTRRQGFKSFNGSIDELRISDTIRYDDPFIPRADNFLPDENTQHLFHFDNDTNDAVPAGNPPGETEGTEYSEETFGLDGDTGTGAIPTLSLTDSSSLAGLGDVENQPDQTVVSSTPTPYGFPVYSPTPTPYGVLPPSLTPVFFNSGQTVPTVTPDQEQSGGESSVPLPTPPTTFLEAVKFSYKNQSVIAVNDDNMKINGSFTIEAWIRPVTEPPGIYIPSVIVSKASPQSLYRTPFSLQLGLYLNNIAPYFSVDADNARYTIRTTSTFLIANQWHHLAASVNAQQGFIKVFVNGTLGGVLYVGHPLLFNDPSIATTIGGLCLDEQNRGACNRYSLFYNGEIDDLRISRISRYASDFTPPATPMPSDAYTLALYRFDSNTLDSSGRNNHGNIQGSVEFTESTIGGFEEN